jgi:hypothetical protein
MASVSMGVLHDAMMESASEAENSSFIEMASIEAAGGCTF